MSEQQVISIASKAGLKRDGTMLESDYYVDGQWVRFQRGLPRKIGGYRSINKYLTALPRSINAYMKNDLTYLHLGSATKVERLYVEHDGTTSVVSNRTPSSLTASANNTWQFAVDHDTANALVVLAQVAPNLSCDCNNDGGQIFYGGLFATTALVELTIGVELPTGCSVTGGVLALHPYTLLFGNAGYIAWSVSGNPINFVAAGSGATNITEQKLLRGMALRGGAGSSPAALLWSLDTLLRATFVGGTPVFDFDTLAGDISVLSPMSIIEFDGIFYWIALDRFLMFNGVVREVENALNSNFFFDGLNFEHRQKVFAFKVPRFGEIWWCYPKDSSEEPNHAIIYNVRENTWYDCALPEEGRGCAASPTVYRYPLLSGVQEQNYIATAVSAIAAAGAGYVAGDILTLVGGTSTVQVELTVSTIGGGGAITAVVISNAGNYTATPSNPVAVTGGTGTGATFTMTFVQPYKLWSHEIGKDMIDGVNTQPIASYFETGSISLPLQGPIDKSLQVLMVEPDFVQSGDMTVQVHGRANARAPEVEGAIKTFVETPTTAQEQVVMFKDIRRQMRFKFASNTLGGHYEAGRTVAHIRPADGTVLG
jgi:hypothetical protein